MCRYGPPAHYKTSWVCVPCRHVAQYHRPQATAPRCPTCRGDLIDAGRDFAAPRKRDTAGWRAVEAVLASGRSYDSCGCSGPGYRPATAAQVRQETTLQRTPDPHPDDPGRSEFTRLERATTRLRWTRRT